MSSVFTTPSRYIKLVSGLLSDGSSLDAGRAQIIDQNVTVLGKHSQRFLGFQPRGSVGNFSGVGPTPYTGIVDAVQPTTPSGVTRIPWDIGNCESFGPVDIIADRQTTLGRTLRKIRVVLTDVVASTGSSLLLMFAITPGSQSPWYGDYYLYEETYATSGTNTLSFDLVTELPAAFSSFHRELRPTRTTTVNGSRNALVIPVTIWFGFYSTASGQSIASVSVYELFEE